MKLASLFLIVFLCLVKAEAKSFTLKEVAQTYLVKSSSIKAQKARLESANELASEAAKRLIPSLSYQFTQTEQKVPAALTGGFDLTPGQVYTAGIAFDQPLFLGGQIWRAKEIRDLTAEIEQLKLAQEEQDSLFNILSSSMGYYTGEQIRKVLQESLKTQQQFVNIVEKRNRRGAAQAYETYQSRADLLSYKVQLEDLDQKQSVLKRTLIEQLELNSEESLQIIVPKEVDFKRSAQSEVEGFKMALESRAEVLISLKSKEMANAEKWLDMGEHFPSLAVQGLSGFRTLSKDDLFDDDFEMYSINIVVDIPFFSGLTSQNIRRSANQKVYAAEMDLMGFRKNLVVEIKEAWLGITQGRKKFDLAKDWSSQAELALKEGLSKYKLGIITTAQLVQLQRGREAAAKAYLESKQSLTLAELKWAKVTGNKIMDVFN